MNTYREELQKLSGNLRALGEKANYLRDESDEDGKSLLNKFRRHLNAADDCIQELDRTMPKHIANNEV